MKFKKSRSMI